MLRTPAKLGGDFRTVDGVAEIVAGPIRDEADEVAVRGFVGAGAELVHRVADRGDDIDVAALGIAADVVGLAGAALLVSTRVSASAWSST